MANKNSLSRRNFVKGAGLGTAAGTVTGTVDAAVLETVSHSRLPREVRVASMTLEKVSGETPAGVVDQVMARLQQVAGAEPDIICLPELFNTSHSKVKSPLSLVAESVPGPTTERLSEFARAHHCYIIAPMSVAMDGKYFNSAVVIDREGRITGRYDGVAATVGEMQFGFSCGTEAQVFETDFGKIGVQICFDVNFLTGWEQLRQRGAEIVFWPSAYPGGRLLQGRAWDHEYYVVTAPWNNPAKVIDITGDVLQESGTWRHWVCAPINLERQLFTWDSGRKAFEEVQQKYGQAVYTEWYHEENWGIVESRSPDLIIAQIIKETGLKPHRDTWREAEEYKKRHR